VGDHDGEPREVEVTFVMTDLSGFSALTAAHGDRHAALVVGRFVEIAETALAPGVRVAERVGDQLLIVAPDPASGLGTALALRDVVDREPLFPAVRTGVHGGSILEQAGSYFGATLNLTARVAAHARPGQVLCTEMVAGAASDLPGVRCRDLGSVQFKNIVDAVRVFEVVTGAGADETGATDPVCRMQVRPDTAPARLPYGGRIHHFCSFDCARAFAARPEAYVDATGHQAIG
jgi:class 3 adenylate cyclase/YHS domain-containing protein